MTALVALPGCGGGEDASADPQDVLDRALSGGEGIDSGVLDVELSISSVTGDQGELDAELQGPFQSNGSGELPSVEFDVSGAIASGGIDFDFDGALTVTTEGLWVGLEGTDYQLDDATFGTLRSAYEQSAAQRQAEPQGSLEEFGVDPRDWVTGLTNEGTEDLDGTEVVHISGSADVPKLVADLNDVAQRTGQATALSAADLNALESSVTAATIDVYAATEDDSLRGIDVGLTLADPRGGSGELDVELSFAITDAGAEQDISAPEDARPLAELLLQLPISAPKADSSPPSSMPPPSASKAAEDYYDCVARANGSKAVEECASLLGG